MNPRFPEVLALAAAAMLACSNGGYNTGTNPYPGGAGGGNGSYGNGGANGGATSGGGSTTGGTGGGTTTGAGTGTGTSSSSGGGSSGGTTGGNLNQLVGPLAFTVASAAEFLPVVTTDGGPAQIEFDLSSFVIDCSGSGGVPPDGLTLVLDLFSGDPNTPVKSGPTYVFTPPDAGSLDGGIPYATAMIVQTDGAGNSTVVATGTSGPVTWSTNIATGFPTGTLFLTMKSSTGLSNLSGTFVAPFCGSF